MLALQRATRDKKICWSLLNGPNLGSITTPPPRIIQEPPNILLIQFSFYRYKLKMNIKMHERVRHRGCFLRSQLSTTHLISSFSDSQTNHKRSIPSSKSITRESCIPILRIFTCSNDTRSLLLNSNVNNSCLWRSFRSQEDCLRKVWVIDKI